MIGGSEIIRESTNSKMIRPAGGPKMRRTLDLSSTAAAFDQGVLASRLASLVGQPPGHPISGTDRSDITGALELISELLSGVPRYFQQKIC